LVNNICLAVVAVAVAYITALLPASRGSARFHEPKSLLSGFHALKESINFYIRLLADVSII